MTRLLLLVVALGLAGDYLSLKGQRLIHGNASFTPIG